MNTTTNINIAKRLITIDTNAWQRLQTYLQAIKTYFATQESGDEIYADIENRISEIMQQQQKAGKVSIQDEDVQQIITTIGDLKTLGITEPIDANDNTTNTQSNTQQQSNNINYNLGPKKLVRNGNDKLISGLCSGIANYFNIDPIWVRLVFLLGLIPGGIGFIGYILGSIFVPKSYEAVVNNKRLFRSTENKMIGGVCSGIAAYIHTNPLYIRLLFISPIILGIITHNLFLNDFGKGAAVFNVPFFGIYILLLILLPKAKTASEKLQMSGQPINANNIRSQVTGQPVYQSSLGSVFGIIAKIFLYSIVGFMLFIIAVVGIGLFSGGAAVMQFQDYLFSAGHQQILANCGWILTCGVPIAFVILLIIKKFSDGFTLPKNIFSYLALAWVFGLFCLLALGKELKDDFASCKQTQPMVTSITNYTGNTLRIQLPADADLLNNSWNNKMGFVHQYKDSISIGNVSIKIEKSIDNNYAYSTSLFARGKSDADMQLKLNKINFVPQFKDSSLVLPIGVVLHKGDLWRGQKVNLTIYVPEGKFILVENEVKRQYNDVNFNTNFPNFSVISTNSFDFETDVWYQFKNGELQNKETDMDNAKTKVDDAKEAVEEAAAEIADDLSEAKDELKTKLEEAKNELGNLKNEDGSIIKNADKKVLESTITVFQNSIDSLEKIFSNSKNAELDKAKQELSKAKITLDSLQKTK